MEKAQSTMFDYPHFTQFPKESEMFRPELYVGVDIGSETFTASIGKFEEKEGWRITANPMTFENDYDALNKFLSWLNENKAQAHNCVVCMEATGVYGEALAYFMSTNGYKMVIEAPLKVKRTFDPEGHKSDPVDSRQIAEYAYRFFDELRPWKPKKEAIEQLKTLLTVREQLVEQRTAHKNANKAIKRKMVRTPLAENVHEKSIEELTKHIKAVEKEIKRLIDDDPSSRDLHNLIVSVPGVGSILATFFVLTFYSAPEPFNPKALAAYIGICPYENTSGISRNKKSTSRRYGPSMMRRFLHLAAMSARTHCPKFQKYFLRKLAEGKPKQLILNNIKNKLVKIVCAIARTKTPYIAGHRSIHPQLLKAK
jgi:transposase